MKIYKDYIKIKQLDGLEVKLPRWRIISLKPGPKIVITALQHGREVSSFLLLQRLLEIFKQRKCLLKGSLIIYPIVNTKGLLLGQRLEPVSGLDINRQYPGDQNNLASLIARRITQEALSADLVIDLHNFTSRRSVFTGIVAKSNERVEEKAVSILKLFKPKFIWRINTDLFYDKEQTGSLTVWFSQQKRLAMALELFSPEVLNNDFLNFLIKGFFRVFAFYKMLKSNKNNFQDDKRRIFVYSSYPVKVKTDVWWWPVRKPGDNLRKFCLLGYVIKNSGEKQPLRTKQSGVVLTIAYPGFIKAGKKVATIGKK